MLFYSIHLVTVISMIKAVQFPGNPTSEMSVDDKIIQTENRTQDQSEMDESAQGVDIDVIEEKRDRKFLSDAMKTVLDPEAVISKNIDGTESLKYEMEELDRENVTFEMFIEEMDKVSLEICKTSQAALWSYVTDVNNEMKKSKMIRIVAEEDEIKRYYWNILKNKYLPREQSLNNSVIQRKIRIVKERGTNVQMPQSKQREEIDTMQRLWSRVSICAYNSTTCIDDSMRSMGDVISIFKTSNDSNELVYYWKTYRDATGKRIRPIFKDYVTRMNALAQSENFKDAGEMWRYIFDDVNFIQSVNKIWSEIKPLYDLFHEYVTIKLKIYYKTAFQDNEKNIPAHLLGNLWAQEWQGIYPMVAPYPNHKQPQSSKIVNSRDLFDAVDEFHQSLGFESAKDSYHSIKYSTNTANCMPSSHDMCDGVHYKIKWCGEKVTDITVGLSRAARLLGHVQYFKHYRNLPLLFRDGPNPAFHEAISDVVVVQLTSPEYLKKLDFLTIETGSEVTMNHLFWLALEKLPLMAYAYALDKWRWDVFANNSLENYNQHWWDIRIKETGVSPPVPRNESDLDPAAKYHVVSHVQYITYLISHVLEFQILLSLCKKANHTGPLHECSIYGAKEAGNLLSEGMSLGASEDWRTVLSTITGETELSTQGFLEYFSTLQKFLEEENLKHRLQFEHSDKNATVLIGSIVVVLTITIIAIYCVKKYKFCNRMYVLCGLSKNGSLDIVTNDIPQCKISDDIDGISENKV